MPALDNRYSIAEFRERTSGFFPCTYQCLDRQKVVLHQKSFPFHMAKEPMLRPTYRARHGKWNRAIWKVISRPIVHWRSPQLWRPIRGADPALMRLAASTDE